MITDHRFVRAAAARIAEAASATSVALGEGLIRRERVFTERLVRRIARQLDGFTRQNLRWRAAAAIEKRTKEDQAPPAADLVGTLVIDLPDYHVRTGFLALSLLIDPDRPPHADGLQTLRKRCSMMNAVTPASYVFVYRPDGIVVVPATAVAGSTMRPDRLHHRHIGRFFEELFSGFLGDPKVCGPKSLSLGDLVRKHHGGAGLSVRVEAVEEPRQERLFRG